MRKGFGLIEFMIVITVFGIATAVITASFLTFERNQRLKSAASMLKNDIRLVQNKALAGDKGLVGDPSSCTSDKVLVGWYVQIIPDTDSYRLEGTCQQLGAPNSNEFGSKIV